jgi:hypothetical protein
MVNSETVGRKCQLDEPCPGIQREAIALCPIQLETDPVIGRSSFWGTNDWPAVHIFGHQMYFFVVKQVSRGHSAADLQLLNGGPSSLLMF